MEEDGETGGEGLMEGIFLEEFPEGAEPTPGEPADGLELDASQADEIKDIFWATLPQYLDPVEEMVGQLFLAEALDDKLRNALVSTLASIRMAAARIGVEEAVNALEAMTFHLDDMDGNLESMARVRDAVCDQLAALRTRAGGGAETTEGAPARETRTLFAALQGAPGVDEGLLERLTSAGLVTVDQMEVASPDEIAAVSGLDMETVHRVLGLLGLGRGKRPPREDELKWKLRAQVEAEMAVEEVRVELQRTRARIEALRKDVTAREADRGVLHRGLAAARQATLERLSEIARLRTERDDLDRRIEAADRRRSHLEHALRGLGEHEARVIEEQAEATENLQALQDRVDQMLQSIYWK